MFSLLSFGTYNYHIIFVIKYIYKKELGAGEVRMLVKDVAGLLFWFGLVWFGLVWFGSVRFGAVRTTSSFSPRHPRRSGRRRRFHHVIPSSPDDVAVFTTSSQRLFSLHLTTLFNIPVSPVGRCLLECIFEIVIFKLILCFVSFFLDSTILK